MMARLKSDTWPEPAVLKNQIMRYLLFFLSLISLALCARANDPIDEISIDINRAGGVYCAYPVTTRTDTPVPDGYKPFYISHVGRHGSRFLLKETDYTNPLNSLKLAHDRGILTPCGEGLYYKVQNLYEYAHDRAGDLTSLGVEQHKGIAKRMLKACPEVFADSSQVTAHSTMVMRCAMSMAAFTEALKEENPLLRITREASEKHVRYLSYQSPEMKAYNASDGKWQKEYKEYRISHAPYQTFMPRIFSDMDAAVSMINPVSFTCQMYNIAISEQNLPEKFELGEIFSEEELCELWKIYNFRMYAHYSNYAESSGVVLKSSMPLLKDIVERAECAIANGFQGADLRFGHDINIIPLTGLIGLDGCNRVVSSPDEVYKVFQDYNISPMASNIQIIFYKNKSDDVIVKFMLNEKEIGIPLESETYPFYDWNEVKGYLVSKYELINVG